MGLFGDSGFLGLGDTGLGQSVNNILEGVEKGIQDITNFRLELPNKVIDFGESLGEKTFDTSSQTAEKFRQEATEFKSRQAISSASGVFGSLVNLVLDNIVIIGLAGLAWFIVKD